MELCRDINLPYFHASNISKKQPFFPTFIYPQVMEEHALVMFSLHNHVSSKLKCVIFMKPSIYFCTGKLPKSQG